MKESCVEINNQVQWIFTSASRALKQGTIAKNWIDFGVITQFQTIQFNLMYNFDIFRYILRCDYFF